MTKKKDSPQIIQGPDGAPAYAVLPIGDYKRLKQLAADAEDLRAARSALEENFRADLVPAHIVHRIARGENPVRVWREHRGHKAVELARAAGISPAYLSEIETGKKDGTFRTMTAIAACLDVSLDDLAPVMDEDERAEREHAQRINRVRAQIRLIEQLVTGSADFSTGAVRQAAESLAGEARQLMDEDEELRPWLGEVLRGVDEIRALIEKAEGNIIETAQNARLDLERVVALDSFKQPPKAAQRRIIPAPAQMNAAE